MAGHYRVRFESPTGEVTHYTLKAGTESGARREIARKWPHTTLGVLQVYSLSRSEWYNVPNS